MINTTEDAKRYIENGRAGWRDGKWFVARLDCISRATESEEKLLDAAWNQIARKN